MWSTQSFIGEEHARTQRERSINVGGVRFGQETYRGACQTNEDIDDTTKKSKQCHDAQAIVQHTTTVVDAMYGGQKRCDKTRSTDLDQSWEDRVVELSETSKYGKLVGDEEDGDEDGSV